MTTVKDKFLKYVTYCTTSDDSSKTFPSTQSQLDFGKILAEECRTIGMSDIIIDKYGYVLATLPSNTELEIPTIGFIAHMDTSPDAKGENVSPIVTENYNGSDIILKEVTLSPKEFPSLNNYIGSTIITSDGTTLLGADNKAGIAEILTAMEYLINHSEIKHGKIKIAFTPDEEIGKGADYFDVKTFGADFAYTIDGGRIGELEYENFNAARAKIKIIGKSVHPGTAKNIMVNASLVGMEIVSQLPFSETPANTENYEGFFHLTNFSGNISNAVLTYIIRDFNNLDFEKRKNLLKEIVEVTNKKYNNIVEIEIHDEYFNMITKIEPHMHIVELAHKAMEQCDIIPIIKPIRGGTDGARLSFMGLPCPNIFTGGHNFHGPYEYIPLSSMEKCVNVIVKIAELSINLNK